MRKLDFVGWEIKKDHYGTEYMLLQCTLTDIGLHPNVTRVHLPIKTDPITGRPDPNTAIFIPFTDIMCCYPMYSTNIPEKMIYGINGLQISVYKPSDVEDVLIVTVYKNFNYIHNDFISYIVHKSPNVKTVKLNSNKSATENYKTKEKSDDEHMMNSNESVVKLETPTITFGKMYDDVIVPSKRPEDAGLDIYPYFAEEFHVIPPHQTAKFNTGLVSHFSPDWFVQLNERGSTGVIGIGQRAGIIDSGYRGEWMVPLTNTTSKWIVVSKKAAQLNKDSMQYARDYYAKIFGVTENEIILYPYNKAICQAIMHRNYDVTVKTDTVDNVKAVPSERGSGRLGSSGK